MIANTVLSAWPSLLSDQHALRFAALTIRCCVGFRDEAASGVFIRSSIFLRAQDSSPVISHARQTCSVTRLAEAEILSAIHCVL